MARTRRQLLLAIVLCLVLVGGTAPARPRLGAPVVAAEDAALADLDGIDQLRDLFNRRAGVPRLILLLSPT